ncbi:sensor histidine kinase [Rhizobium glycinendophyticum]|uniref:sensor histidine kinase n=1 Tax=Rhizobium glycinendophyticum TaxID=2589807 RepID=UPI001375DFF5|nr:histidine kinase dimerization/phosphoacceptor domain -containing protein [Rhizobium glycinendophyticum]
MTLGPNLVLRWFRAIQIGGVLLPLIGCLIWTSLSFRAQWNAATEHAVDTVGLVRQYSQRLVETQLIKHRAALSRVEGENTQFLRSEPFHRFLTALDSDRALSYGLAVIALDGEVIASSRSFPVNVRFGQRDYLDAVRDGAGLFIDRIKLEPGDRDAMVVASAFIIPGFRGAIVSSMPAESSRTFLRTIAASDGEAASLLREDGKLLVRQIPAEPLWLPPDSPALTSIKGVNEGVYEALAVSDGIKRIYAFSRLENLSLVANFGVPTDQIFQATFQTSLPVWLLMLAISAFTLVASGLARRSILAQIDAEVRALRLAEAETRAHQRSELVREMNHRVKNNLAMVSSLINLHQRQKGKVDAQDLQMRVRALAEVHDLLYRSSQGEKIDLGILLRRACDPGTLMPEERGIRFDYVLPEGILLAADRASPLALAVLELVTNAVKHAFVERDSGTIHLTLKAVGEEEGEITISDDGVGMAVETTRRSGTGLVDAFVQQVGGEISRTVESGTRYVIRFAL